ncbi:hypothetical protein EG328_008450 [Venturia inaequalis]|uniref:Uncharacterized protein n=1 Tax=Venturia inaequalis TaxID=5025 RepID=A0A8H3UV85_VENIN|nr:hypothetical protein EG327_007792 [Venturia inaequalis]KAE9984616.1 hypothetical protein EG328_008450 [Venturia inaequalis]RDI87166.1 hypothetical protein Vi05172_g2794 [Venturia inaequalis]
MAPGRVYARYKTNDEVSIPSDNDSESFKLQRMPRPSTHPIGKMVHDRLDPRFKINDEVSIASDNGGGFFNVNTALRVFGWGRNVGRVVSVRPFRLTMWTYRVEGVGIDEFIWWREGEVKMVRAWWVLSV